MKKTVLSLAFLSIFASNAFAQESQEKDVNEDILNNVLKQLMTSKEQPKDTKIPQITKSNPQVKKLDESIEDKSNKIDKEKPQLIEVVQQPNMQLVEEKEIRQDTFDDILNGNMIIQDIHSSEKELNIQDTPEYVFLLNIPIKTKIRVNVDLVLPPYRDKISYYQGNLTSGNPFDYTSKATFCYLNVVKSGLWRRFKADENKFLNVISNVSHKKLYQYNESDIREIINVFETTFSFDNDHIKNLVCESSEKELPLTIGDLNKATGNLFDFEITPMLDI
jgi:hypothetical protein